MPTFGETLRARMADLGLSVKAACARTHVEPAQLRMWMNDDRTPAPERQAVLLAALNIPVVVGDGAEYQRGALWALGAMHETLGRLYREMAGEQPVISAADLRQLEAVTQHPASAIQSPHAEENTG